MGIGIESGLFEDPDGRLCDLTACCIFDGEQEHVGYSCAWVLPDACSKKIKEEGMDMTQAANATGLCDDPKIGDKGGLLGVLTGGRVTRPQYTIQSIQMAILSMNKALYACSSSVPAGINDQVVSSGAGPVTAAHMSGFLWGIATAASVALVTFAVSKKMK